LKWVTDQDAHTAWEGRLPKNKKGPLWIEAKWEKPVTLGSYSIARGVEWINGLDAKVFAADGKGGWKNVTPKKGKLKWETMKFFNSPVTTDQIRIEFNKPVIKGLAELEFYPPVAQ
jgi:hypothetical protein